MTIHADTATIRTIRQRWHSGHHVGEAKPVCRAYVRTGAVLRKFRKVDVDEIYSVVPGITGKRIWKGLWDSKTSFQPLPNLKQFELDHNFDENGVAQATLTLDNVEMVQKSGVAGIYHMIERGYYAPYRGYKPPNRPKVGTKNDWFDLLNDKSSQIIVLAGYGDKVIPVFLGLVNDLDMSSRPDEIKLTCRDMGQYLTDQHVFQNAKVRNVPDPITFADRRNADKEKVVGYGVSASSRDPQHPGRYAIDHKHTTFWRSKGNAHKSAMEWIEIHLPAGRYENFWLHPRYAGMEMYVAIEARDKGAPGGHGARRRFDENLPQGWVDEGRGHIPGTSIPYVRHVPNVKAKRTAYSFPEYGYTLGDNSRIRLYFTNLSYGMDGGRKGYPLFRSEGPRFYAQAFDHNKKFAKGGPYNHDLSGPDETDFRAWVSNENIPFNVHDDKVDYDMRRYWHDNGGTPHHPSHSAGDHFPDTYKTPYDTSFSAESMYATNDCPFKWHGDSLIDERNGRVVYGTTGRGRAYRAGVIGFEGIRRRTRKEARREKWILVDDLSDVVRTVFQWCGINEWEVETTGVRLKDKAVFNRGNFLIDIVNAAAEQVGFVFYMKPPESFDEDNLGTSHNLSTGVAVFRRNQAITRRPFDKVEIVHEDSVLRGIDAKITDEPLAAIIRVRGKQVKKKRGGRQLGGDRVRRHMYVYRPPWARDKSVHAIQGHDFGSASQKRNGNVKKYAVYHDERLRNLEECKIAALFIAFREALESAQVQIEAPAMPSIMLDHQTAIFDTGTGLSTRFWVALRGMRYTGGEDPAFVMTLGGAMLDFPDIIAVREELMEALRNSNYDPGLSTWEREHFGNVYRNQN